MKTAMDTFENGGIVLAGIGGALSCRDIANANYQQEKKEISVACRLRKDAKNFVIGCPEKCCVDT
ncbi:MAG: hypothetical protein GXP14_00370 [Gammaproteobacteria bacterium]|nr:hypothetical protein [Gammaproteobacteria bacterium]